MTGWRQRAREIRRDTYALYLACRDPRVPWYAKALAGIVVAYALSPIDLIPDFIPVLGYLDDAILLPIGVLLVRRMIPASLLAEHRELATARFAEAGPHSRLGAAIVVGIWVAVLAVVVAYVL